jgi:hypothetical protein
MNWMITQQANSRKRICVQIMLSHSLLDKESMPLGTHGSEAVSKTTWAVLGLQNVLEPWSTRFKMQHCIDWDLCSCQREELWFLYGLLVLFFTTQVDLSLNNQKNFSPLQFPEPLSLVWDAIIKLSSTEKSQLPFCGCLPPSICCKLCETLCRRGSGAAVGVGSGLN